MISALQGALQPGNYDHTVPADVCSNCTELLLRVNTMCVTSQADERIQRHYDFPTKRILLTRDPKDISRRGQHYL